MLGGLDAAAILLAGILLGAGLALAFGRRRVARAREEREAAARSDRLSAVGTLVAGVAHEINNPLTVVVGNIELALLDLRDSAPHLAETARSLETALSGADRIAQVARALKVVGRSRPAAEREPVRLNAVLDHVAGIVRASAPGEVEVACDASPEDPSVLANAADMHQLVLHLARNAVDATMEKGGGRVLLATRAIADEDVEVVVRDAGPGILPEDLARLFTPFFTTKPKGTGLGLSIVHTIAREQGGHVRVDSTPGRGATFVVRLPRSGLSGRVEEDAPLNTRGV